ncbi:MAG: DUF4384 domain-containing protein [Spirochaetaceae bacterium]
MKKKVISVNIILLFILTSCVSTQKDLPQWAEIKPANTANEIFFVFGPASSRDLVKKGLYKEISEYFGVKVSSVDKFVKDVSFENGETDIKQSTSSKVDVSSREKGLNSIEIRELWSDESTNRWCIMASIDKKSVEIIKKQVELDIENERTAEVLRQGEDYSKVSRELYDAILSEFSELTKIEIKMNQVTEKIKNMSIYTEIMDTSREGLTLSQKSNDIVKNIKVLTNDLNITYRKNELLKSQLVENPIEMIELEFFIKESSEFFTKAEFKSAELENFDMKTTVLTEELNRQFLAAELEVLGDEESQKIRLNAILSRLSYNSNSITKLRDDSELLFKQSEDTLRQINQLSINKTLEESEKNKQLSTLLRYLEDDLLLSQGYVSSSYDLKSSIGLDYSEAVKSHFITKTEKQDIKSIKDSVDSPVSWIIIYKDKIQIILNKSNKVTQALSVNSLIDVRLASFASNLSSKTKSDLELTIGEFTIEDTSISSEFSNYVKGKLFTSIANKGSFHIVDYKSVTDFLTSKNINPKTIYEGTSTDNLLVENIAYGNYWVHGNEIELNISVKNIKNSRVLYSEVLKFPKNSIPVGIGTIPPNFNNIVSLDKKLQGVKNQKGFDVWPDKGNGSIYTNGEDMIINIFTPVSGYVKIYHISADNQLTLVFPNKFDKNNKLQAGTHYTIGDGSYPFKFSLGKPFGTESLKAVFSAKQFSDLVSDNYKDGFLYSGIRGINIENRINSDLDMNSAVATSYYTITK